ncbi:MAG: peptidoglycan-binding protein, partial [Actinobacteria bacterium]|nr:peptidoglycan-binding protein [Actinomycetota bacterium]
DGVFGSGTLRLVKRFQKTVVLKQTGVINHETWMALLSASSQQ